MATCDGRNPANINKSKPAQSLCTLDLEATAGIGLYCGQRWVRSRRKYTYHHVVVAGVYPRHGVRDLAMIDKERLANAEAHVVCVFLLALLVEAVISIHSEHGTVDIS